MAAVLERAKTLYSPRPSLPLASPTSPTSPSYTSEIDTSFSITGSDDSDSEEELTTKPTPSIVTEGLDSIESASPLSPLEQQSRNFMLEEGEIFRKGVIVDVENEELDVSGEELKKEVSTIVSSSFNC